MAKLTRQKARKEYECCKCKKTISKGEIYQKITEMYSKPKIVCNNCVVSRCELTSSEYLSWLYELQDTFRFYSSDEVDELIGYLEDQKSELEEKLYNIPEQFQNGEPASILEDRIDGLDEAISQLEQLDFNENEDREEPSEEEIQGLLEEAEQILSAIM